MPFVETPDIEAIALPVSNVPAAPEEAETPRPAFINETLPAAFRRESVPRAVYEAVSSGSMFVPPQEFEQPDPDYDPFADISGYEDYATSFVTANTPDDVARIKTKIDGELQDLETLHAAGWQGFAAAMAAGVMDPTVLIPIGGQIRAGVTTGRAALSTAGRTAAVVAPIVAGTEVVLHADQETRTVTESALNIGAGTVLAGVLGGSIGGIASKQLNNMMGEIETRLLRGEGIGPVKLSNDDLIADTGTGSASLSAGSAWNSVAGERLKSAFGLEKNPGLLNTFNASPRFRLATSRFMASRQIQQELVEGPYIYEKNALGTPTPQAVETMIGLWDAPIAKGLEMGDMLYAKYRSGVAPGGGFRARMKGAAYGVRDLAGRQEGVYTRSEFFNEVGRVMRRGDVSHVPEIEELAKFYRKNIFDPLKDDAIQLRLLPEDVMPETALSYLTRVYDTGKMTARRPHFKRITVDWLRSKHADIPEAELEGIADQIMDSILRSPGGRVPYEKIKLSEAGPLKERTFSIPDDMIEEFLISDINVVSHFYVRSMAPDIELAKRFGTIDMADQIARIRNEYSLKSDAIERLDASPQKKETMQKALKKEADADQRDILAMRDMLRSTYAAPADPNSMFSRTVRGMKQVNFLSLLGMMMLSSFGDAARTVMAEGMFQTFKAGIVPMVRNMKTFRLAAQEGKAAGVGIEIVKDTRALSLADIGDDFGRLNTKLERGLDAASRNFGLLTLQTPWTASLRQIHSVVAGDRMLRDMPKFAAGKLDRRGTELLAASGIGRDMAERIVAQVAKHGKKQDGVRIANAEAWDDAEAVTVFRAALRRETTNAVIHAGVGDRPLMASKLGGSPELGGMIFQITSFLFASHQKILFSGLQRRDMATVNGLLVATGLGMLSYKVKADINGRETSDDPRVWLKEGLDWGGVMGYLPMINGISEKATRGVVGANMLTGGEISSRFASRGLVDAILGPSVGAVYGVGALTGSIATGEIFEDEEARKQAWRTMRVPYQNLFYLRALMTALDEDK